MTEQPHTVPGEYIVRNSSGTEDFIYGCTAMSTPSQRSTDSLDGCSGMEAETDAVNEFLSSFMEEDRKDRSPENRERPAYTNALYLLRRIGDETPRFKSLAQEIPACFVPNIKDIVLMLKGTSTFDDFDINSFFDQHIEQIITGMQGAKFLGYANFINTQVDSNPTGCGFFSNSAEDNFPQNLSELTLRTPEVIGSFSEAELASILLKLPDLLRSYLVGKVRDSLAALQLSLAIALQWLQQLAAKAENQQNFRLVDQRLRVPRPVCARPRPPSAALAPPA